MATLRFQVTEIKTERSRVTHEVELDVDELRDLEDVEGEILSLMDSGCSDEVDRDDLGQYGSEIEQITIIN